MELPICKEFLNGKCKNGRKCDKKHPRGKKGSLLKNKRMRIKENKISKNKSFVYMSKHTKLSYENCEDFLNDICYNQHCKLIHNFSLKYQKENNDEFARRYFSLNQDFSVLSPYEKKLFEKSNLDIMFIVDCTGSMNEWIDATKNELEKILDYIKTNNPYAKIRISFVGYRDYCDNKLNFKQVNRGINSGRFSYIDFEEDSNEIKNFLFCVSARGGGDEPEDLAGGLKMGLNMSWKSEAKYAVIITDAPCHGKKYHDLLGDQYPKGDPTGLDIEELVKEYARLNINLFSIRISSSTRKMERILSSAYQEIAKRPIIIADLGKSTEKFAFFVANGASNTLSSITMNNISLKDFIIELNKDTIIVEDSLPEFDLSYNDKLNMFYNRINYLMGEEEIFIPSEEASKKTIKGGGIRKEVNYVVDNSVAWPINDHSNIKLAKCYSFEIVKDRNTNINWKKPYIVNSFIESQIIMSNIPFSEGSMRYAFYMIDLDLNQKLVSKLPKAINMFEYNLENLSKDLEAITICHHISNEFNDRVINIVPDTRLLINFVNCWIYEIDDKDMQYNLFLVENFVDGFYQKYNNNAGWINTNLNENALIAQAFSHFSWQITKGYLMIVDLQGIDGILTDPQIHCLNNEKYGKGNLGYVGMIKFFLSHICNSYCKRMELIHPRDKFIIDEDYDFFIEKYIPPMDITIYKLCSICKNPFQGSAKKFYELRKKCWDCLCDNCENERKNSLKEGLCVMCKMKFKSSQYWFKMRRQNFPDRCMKCRIDRRAIERNELEV